MIPFGLNLGIDLTIWVPEIGYSFVHSLKPGSRIGYVF